MNRSITAKQIAARLGISQPTVSRALSETQGHLVAPETRERVLEVARRLGYRPNAAARSLRSRRTNIVGFYSGYGYLDPRDEFLTQMIGGLQRACDHNRMDLLLHGVYRGRSTDDIFAELMDGRIDGLFVHTSLDDPLIQRLAEAALPVVAVADMLPGIPSVGCDDAAGMLSLLHFLFDKGYRQMVFLGPNKVMPSVETRRRTFETFMEQNGLPVESLCLPFDDPKSALDTLLVRKSAPRVACCWNDMFAYNMLRACRDHGVRVPEQIGVTGFDGFFDQKFPAAQLTTVEAPWQEVADRACELLMAQIGGQTVPAQSVLPVRFFRGDTA